MTDQESVPSTYAPILGREPGQIVRPESVDQVVGIVAQAQAAGQAVIPWGGGTGQDYGHPPRRADILLDLSGLNRIVAVEAGDMTITVEPGVTLAQVQEALAPHRQFLPLDPPQPERATIGGILATNAHGPLRLGYGTARDWLIGLRVVDAAGRLVKGGGKVVKNVTGYDLPKMHIGALGTLGVIVEATFKTAPRPEAVRTLVARLDEGGDVAGFLDHLQRETAPMQILVHAAEDGQFVATLFHGPVEAVEEAATKGLTLAQSARFTAAVYDEELTPDLPSVPLAVRIGTRPAAAWALHQALWAEAGGGATLETQIGVGGTVVSWAVDSEEARLALRRLVALAQLNDRSVTLLHAPVALRGGDFGDLWFPLPSSLPLQQGLKNALDPNAILNPGRFVGGL